MDWLYKSRAEIWASYSTGGKLATMVFIIILNLVNIFGKQKATIKGIRQSSEVAFYIICEIGMIVYAVYLACNL